MFLPFPKRKRKVMYMFEQTISILSYKSQKTGTYIRTQGHRIWRTWEAVSQDVNTGKRLVCAQIVLHKHFIFAGIGQLCIFDGQYCVGVSNIVEYPGKQSHEHYIATRYIHSTFHRIKMCSGQRGTRVVVLVQTQISNSRGISARWYRMS